MEFLPLEVQEHIGLYLPPNDYKQFWMSFRNSLPLKQRITLRTLKLCGQLEQPLSKENSKCFKGLQLVVTDQLGSDDWDVFEDDIVVEECDDNKGIRELYLNVIRRILNDIPAWFDTQGSFDFALQLCCEYGQVDLVQPLLSHFTITPSEDALEFACEFGNSEIVELLFVRILPLSIPHIDGSSFIIETTLVNVQI